MRIRFVLALLVLLAAPAAAQESPFVPPEVFEAFAGELSGDRSYDLLRHLTLHHSPNAGSRGFREKMRWIEQRAREAGLADVRMIDDLPWNGVGWTPLRAELWVVAPERRRLTGYDDVAVAVADNSTTGRWEGELVYVGAGTREADYDGRDVAGKIVLATGAMAAVTQQAVYDRGAIGVVHFSPERGIDYPDQVGWTRLPARPPEGKQNTFGFSLSYRAGQELVRRLERGERIRLAAEVEAEFLTNATQWILEGRIRGRRSDQSIILTAHAQEEKTSANDDNSGCANLLEIARAWTKLIAEGRLSPPERDVRFWWVNEIAAPYAYFARHPEEAATVLVNINQDMVGAKQSAGSRIQHITRTPHSRPSYLDDVIGSVATMVMRGNSAYLAAGQAGSPTPFSRALVSRTGTRERFGAEIVPFFGNTDHYVFNDGAIGIPGVTLTNWPDPFIHTSDDDLWQMDPTQLLRNAFIVATTAHYLAGLRSEGVPLLAATVHANARRTMSEAFARSTELLALAPAGEMAAAFHDGVNLIDQTARRAAAALDSVTVFGLSPAVGEQLERFRYALAESAVAYRMALAASYSLLSGQASAPPARPTEEERAMALRVPELAVGLAELRERRGRVGDRGLHGLMAFEVWNLVDGRRSYLDIYRAVRAQAQLAGEWYYGKVTARQVTELLDAAVEEGLLRLAP